MGSHLSALAESVRRVLVRIASFPGILYRRALLVVKVLVDVLHFVFVKVPRWLIVELPQRVMAALRAIAHGVIAFFSNEVVPTAEFFVEVLPGLAGATARDLLVRTPLWVVVRGPGALADLAKAMFSQLVVLVVAMFDRARGLVNRLIDGALFVWDTIEGGLRWIVLLLFVQFAPWLVHFGFEVFDQAVLLGHSVIILAIAVRRWLWQTVLSLPGRIARLIEQMILMVERAIKVLVDAVSSILHAIPVILERVVEAVVQLVRALPRVIRAIVRSALELLNFLFVQVPLNILRGLWDLTTQMLRAVFIDFPRYVFNVLTEMVRTVWQIGDALVRFVYRLPGYVWQVVVFVFTTLPQELWRAFVSMIRGLARMVTEIARALSEPTMTILTWVLALVIAPFYFLA